MAGDDKMQNKAEELKGRAKEAAGDATGNEQWQAEGKGDQAKGNIKQAGEKIKDAAKGVFGDDKDR
ncbi:CsbD family protein [Amycolatopsis sp. K13G38]|uniref:CsbD family protein n=2 Tax=Amycolatopsis acididurans TaxID=2724524 RepID=A0ABX1IWH4_9PSEU|nr:CsbD family protein [Amycolatopsis acididurans]